MRKKYTNNKGMAMVTVLICIAFIAILSSTLAYMAYMNFLTKSLRHTSTNNFYTGEFALDELSSSLQEICAVSEPGTVDQAKSNLRSKTTKGDVSKGYFDPDKLENLLMSANSDPNITIDVESPLDGGSTFTYEEFSNYILYRGVRLITRDEKKGDITQITTDIILQFDGETKGKYDINDFSLVCDSYATTSSSQNGNKNGSIVFTGCTYMKDTKNKGYAFKCDNHRCTEFLGDYNIIDGNFEIDTDCTVVVNGNLTINGELKIKDGGMLICNGPIQVAGSKIANCEQKIYNSDMIKWNAKIELPDVDEQSLALQIFAKTVLFNNKENNTIIDMGAKFTPAVDYFRDSTNNNSGSNIQNKLGGNGTYKDYQTVMLTGAQQNFQSDSNSLAIIAARNPIMLRSDLKNFTCVALTEVEMVTNDMETNTHLSDEAYMATKKILIKNQQTYGTLERFYCNNTLSDVTGDGTVDFDDMIEYVYQVSNGNTNSPYNGFKAYTYDAEGGLDSKEVVKNMSLEEKKSTKIDQARRYLLVDSNGENYIPYGYLLNPKAGKIIEKYIEANSPSEDPRKTQIKYTNWSKD